MDPRNCGYCDKCAEGNYNECEMESFYKEDPVGWLRAIDEALVSAHLGVANSSDSYETAKAKLAALINWHIDAASDPAVNSEAVSKVLKALETLKKVALRKGCNSCAYEGSEQSPCSSCQGEYTSWSPNGRMKEVLSVVNELEATPTPPILETGTPVKGYPNLVTGMKVRNKK